MDRQIRKLQRLASVGDTEAAEKLEAALNRIGPHALFYREQANKDVDPIEIVEADFDETHFHRKMGVGWITVRCTCCGAGFSSWRPYTKRWKMRDRKRHNAKHRTIRSHRKLRARK